MNTMTEQEKAKELYEGKFFYEIADGDYCGQSCKMLFGPLDTIRYLSPAAHTDKTLDGSGPIDVKYKFGQVIDGKLVQVFKENEILVTDRKL